MNDSPMFLDTVELVIHLPAPTQSSNDEFSFENRKVWRLDHNKGFPEYTFLNDKAFTISLFEYKPRLKYRTRKNKLGVLVDELLVELSIPKFLLGNNFMDTPKSSLNEFYSKLLDTINYLYCFKDITLTMLENATLKRIDCGSQIFFPNIMAYNLAQNRIFSARTDPRIDIGEVKFANYGSGIYLSCDSWQFVFYNKTEELKAYAKSEKKAKFEKDSEHMIGLDNLLGRTMYTNPLLIDDDVLDPGKAFFDMITSTEQVCMRFELRLNQKSKINNALEHIGESEKINECLTLQVALENNIPQRILQWYYKRIFSHLPRYDLVSASDEDLLNYVAQYDNKIDRMAKVLGYITMERIPNQKQLRKIITNGKSQSAWNSYLKKIDQLPILANPPDPIQPILDKIFSNVNKGEKVSYEQGR